MSTTVEQIEANLIALGYDNPSQLAGLIKLSQGSGIPIDVTLAEFTNSENRILNIITLQRYGRALYYTTKALAFQYLDNLIIDPVTFEDVYAIINPLNLIVKQAAFEEIASGNSSQLFLKVATINATSGDLEALDANQKAAFDNYFVNFEIPGLPITKVSLPGNIISFLAVASYYKTYDLTTFKANLKAALTTFRQTFGFNGEFFTGDLQDYLKANVPGMRDFYASATTIDGIPFGGATALTSGYFNFPSPYDTFLNNITYAPV